MRSKTTQKIIASTPDEIRKSVREYANEQDKQRIQKEATEYCEGSPHYLFEYRGYIAGATAELERSEKLLQEYREVIRELLPYAENDYYVQIVKYLGIESFAAATLLKKINRAKNLI